MELAGDGVDHVATEERRRALRAVRLNDQAPAKPATIDIARARQIADGLVLAGANIGCRKCGYRICPASENYKHSCAMSEQPITAANPHILDPKTYVDDEMVLRAYACPSCGLLLGTEIVRLDDPPLWDIQLAV